ncbi:hypothetical protein C7S18_05640 [Ahniella affigens]|uniref:GAF domain-containing protein n=1 Tax=Ahniella affigens TaxID=2021234 RepID=A0A2P1PPF5_9GAMM|nr:GAF domain-containing protein [Ahniella affigens]AVP96715.1 hypothetical protein C7S18_05640 [Ahniella affigens]
MTAAIPIQIDAAAEAALTQLLVLLRKSQSPREAAWALTSQAIAALGLEDCVVYLTNPDGQTLTQVAAFGPKLKATGLIENAITLRFAQGIVGNAAANRLLIRVDDTRLDSRYVLDDDQRLSELAVPILRTDDVLGVIDSEHTLARFFTDHHERLLRQMAALLADRLTELQQRRS